MLCAIAVALLHAMRESDTVIVQAVRIQYELWSIAYNLESAIVDAYADYDALTDGWKLSGRLEGALREARAAYLGRKRELIQWAQQSVDQLEQEAAALHAESNWFHSLFDAYCQDYPSLGLLERNG